MATGSSKHGVFWLISPSLIIFYFLDQTTVNGPHTTVPKQSPSLPTPHMLNVAITPPFVGRRTMPATITVRLSPTTISTIRTSLQWTKRRFAQHLGVSHDAVARWELGEAYPQRRYVREELFELGKLLDLIQ